MNYLVRLIINLFFVFPPSSIIVGFTGCYIEWRNDAVAFGADTHAAKLWRVIDSKAALFFAPDQKPLHAL